MSAAPNRPIARPPSAALTVATHADLTYRKAMRISNLARLVELATFHENAPGPIAEVSEAVVLIGEIAAQICDLADEMGRAPSVAEIPVELLSGRTSP